MSIVRAIRARLASEAGIAMPAVIGIMMLLLATSAAILSTVQADTPLSRRDQDRKAAYAAAEAGVNQYIFRLSRDPDIWSTCAALTGQPFVSQQWNGSGADPRPFRALPGAGSEGKYTVEMLPNASSSSCNAANPSGTMLEQGVLRVRATGIQRGIKRSIIAKLRHRTFLDFIYFTDYETSDPAWYVRQVSGAPTTPDITGWATANCKYWRDGRGSQTYNGVYFDSSNQPHNFSTTCSEIQFVTGDRVRGPFHTNDSLLICGTPIFGRTISDRVEVTEGPPFPGVGWRNNSCSGTSPNFVGTYKSDQPALTLPPTNDGLLNDTQAAYILTGQQTIVLGPSSMTVNGVTRAYPSNGLIYVKNGACGQGYKPYDPYNQPAGCANVFVSGNYGQSLTIASQKDIIVNEDLTFTNDALLGLIANEFVRVYHPVSPVNSNSCSNSTSALNDLTIQAAILSLAHSFTVDNYFCGNALNNLSVTGVIAQKYRGPVGTSGGGGRTGYLKNYVYDDRYAYRSPPHFLDPVASSWRVISENEQAPAR